MQQSGLQSEDSEESGMWNSAPAITVTGRDGGPANHQPALSLPGLRWPSAELAGLRSRAGGYWRVLETDQSLPCRDVLRVQAR